MPKSVHVLAVDKIQAALRPILREHGFGVRGRAFNRVTEDGLTQVVSFFMGPSDPPGTTYVPGLTRDLHGLFSINLGVYVPEVAEHHGGGVARSWVREYHCCVRSTLAELSGEVSDYWWFARFEAAVLEDVRWRLEGFGFPFLERFSSRDKLLTEWREQSENVGQGSPPRIVMAIILVRRGQQELARLLLSQQALETRNPGHPAYVRELARKLGLGPLDA